MHYILPTRDLIANDIEMMIQAHRLDAIVLLCSCDKIVPGMLMAAARRIPEATRYVAEARWKTWGPQLLLGTDVFGATLGVVGFGRIGGR